MNIFFAYRRLAAEVAAMVRSASSVFVAAALVLSGSSAFAAMLTVTSDADSGEGTLRQLITEILRPIGLQVFCR